MQSIIGHIPDPIELEFCVTCTGEIYKLVSMESDLPCTTGKFSNGDFPSYETQKKLEACIVTETFLHYGWYLMNLKCSCGSFIVVLLDSTTVVPFSSCQLIVGVLTLQKEG